MHTTTFYSYKGGVGRTLALMNVACGLVGDSENVFLIDFDLEAPGLQTFDIFKRKSEENDDAREQLGLSDLIYKYMSDPSEGLPDIADYVIKGDTSLLASDGNPYRRFSVEKPGKMFLLPAGTRRAYAQIDWQRLYEEQEGFFFFEMLKSTIAKHEEYAPNWLLIDSRTGRAETTGICTRQLADTNVLVFFPNEQNRIGFEEVFPQIRDEPSRKLEGVDPCNFIFVASRVPVEDDEFYIIETQINKFRHVFGLPTDDEYIYLEDGMILRIPQNNSVELLEQSLFLMERPGTKLGKSYQSLVAEIQKMNSQSKRGVELYLNELLEHIIQQPRRQRGERLQELEMRRKYEQSLPENQKFLPEVVKKKLLDVAFNHPHDQTINRQLSECYAHLDFNHHTYIKNAHSLAIWHGLVAHKKKKDKFEFYEPSAALQFQYIKHRRMLVDAASDEGFYFFLNNLHAIDFFLEAFAEPDGVDLEFMERLLGEELVRGFERLATFEPEIQRDIPIPMDEEQVEDNETQVHRLMRLSSVAEEIGFAPNIFSDQGLNLDAFESNVIDLFSTYFPSEGMPGMGGRLTYFEWLVLTGNIEKLTSFNELEGDSDNLLFENLAKFHETHLLKPVVDSIKTLMEITDKPPRVKKAELVYRNLLLSYPGFLGGGNVDEASGKVFLERNPKHRQPSLMRRNSIRHRRNPRDIPLKDQD